MIQRRSPEVAGAGSFAALALGPLALGPGEFLLTGKSDPVAQ
jgi:hypothetical protein